LAAILTKRAFFRDRWRSGRYNRRAWKRRTRTKGKVRRRGI